MGDGKRFLLTPPSMAPAQGLQTDSRRTPPPSHPRGESEALCVAKFQ